MSRIPVFLLSKTSDTRNAVVMSPGAFEAFGKTFLQDVTRRDRTATAAASYRASSGTFSRNDGVQRERRGRHQIIGIRSDREACGYIPGRFIRRPALDSPDYCHFVRAGLKSSSRTARDAFLPLDNAVFPGILEADGHYQAGQQRNALSTSPADHGVRK